MRVQEAAEIVSEGGLPPAEPAMLTVVIQPTRGLGALQLRAVWEYRELLYFLGWSDVKVRYNPETARGMADGLGAPEPGAGISGLEGVINTYGTGRAANVV
jgi:hypothetical protein